MSAPDRSPRDGVFAPLATATVVIGVLVAGFAAWSWMAPVSSAVIAEGRFKVEGDVKTVQHLEGGIVSELLVTDGDRVRAGDTLIELDATDARATLAAFVAERDTLLARKVRLEAELAASARPDFASLEAMNRPSADAAIISQSTLFEARRKERAAEEEMLAGTLSRLSTRLEAQQAELGAIEAQQRLVQEDTDAARSLAKTGLVTRVNLNARERELASLTGGREALTAGIAETQASQVEARLTHAQSQTRFISAVSKDLSEVVAALAGITPRIDAEEQRIARARVTAPLDGIVVRLKLATIGGVVAPGEPIMDIVPAGGALIAEARLQPAARERLRVGMPVKLRLPGVRSRKEPGLDGTIDLISAELTDDPDKTGHEDEPTYAVKIALADIPEGVHLEPGMPVTSVIAMDARTALDYLLSPMTDAMARSMREN